MAYWLVTGKLVFEGTAIRTMAMHLNDRPTPPSARTELVIPTAFERVIMQCLEKEPAARPHSADQLDRLLGECATGAGWSERHAREWWESVAPAPFA